MGEKGSAREHLSVTVWMGFLQGMKSKVMEGFRLNWACQKSIVHFYLQCLWRNFFTLDFQTEQNEVLNNLTFWKEDHR